MSDLKPDKGLANGSCNRTACQAPLADEPEHQFMGGIFTGGPRLHYCAHCAADFDSWDFRSGDRVRITREPKATPPLETVSVGTKAPLGRSETIDGGENV